MLDSKPVKPFMEQSSLCPPLSSRGTKSSADFLLCGSSPPYNSFVATVAMVDGNSVAMFYLPATEFHLGSGFPTFVPLCRLQDLLRSHLSIGTRRTSFLVGISGEIVFAEKSSQITWRFFWKSNTICGAFFILPLIVLKRRPQESFFSSAMKSLQHLYLLSQISSLRIERHWRYHLRIPRMTSMFSLTLLIAFLSAIHDLRVSSIEDVN